MEDFDYIDALAKKALSDRTATPSENGWNAVQQQMKRKKRKRFLLYMMLLALVCSLGIFVAVQSSTTEATSITNHSSQTSTSEITNNNRSSSSTSDSSSTSKKHTIKPISNSISTSSSNSTTIVNDTSRAENTLDEKTSATATDNLHATTNNVHGEKNGLAKAPTAYRSRFITKKADEEKESNAADQFYSESQMNQKVTNTFFTKEGEFIMLNQAGVKLYPWELETSEMFQEKRKKKQTNKNDDKVYEQLDLMVGFNGFVRPNDYNFIGSYVFELSYTDEKKLKKNNFFLYGASLQFRNLRFKQDSISFNKGELSLNIHSGFKKYFGNFAVEAGGYVGYELYSPNNEFFNRNNINFFDRKINYGLFSEFEYKKVGLVFKYEFSPYINYTGGRQFGAFSVGVKYDF